MERSTQVNGGFGLVDNLAMTYDGNMLTSVRDNASRYSYAGATDFDGVSGQEYPLTYNDAGSLVSDAGRRTAWIDYDLMNNPVRIQFTNGNVTKYVYSATGEKLRVTYQTAVPNISVPIGSTRELAFYEVQYTDSTDYLLGGRLTLKNGRIDKYQFEEGYCQAEQYVYNTSQDVFTFCYYDRDHLGSIRQVTEADGSREGYVIQRMNYYPFGAEFCDGSASSNVQSHRYNGKEFDKMHGLNTYDYGARQYNPVTARWDRVDPLAEKYYSMSPYNYCGGNPIRFIDPNGKWKWDVNGNLISEGRDNEYTLSDFLNTSVYNASLLLSTYRILHNDNNEYLEGGIVLNKDNLYIMEIDYAAPVVHNTKEAVIHYYHGNGEPADVGDESTAELMSSPEFINKHSAITTENQEIKFFVVNMTNKTFHIGKTNVECSIDRENQASSVTYTLFAKDGFHDPLDIGIEAGGTPYEYKTRKVTYYFKPIKGYKKRK